MDKDPTQTQPEASVSDRRALRANCTRALSGHPLKSPRRWFEDLAASPLADLPSDMYGEGPVVQMLEQEVAQLLGKEAAVFIHKGVVAQQIALRVWADRRAIRNIALHPKSHIDADERSAYERLHNLAGVRVGKDQHPFRLQELKDLHEPLGAITVELPLRRAGYKLPPWEELVAISEWAHEQHIPLHFDGARLWESAPYYKHSYAEIAALSDSVYVSFYKGLGGLGGCILAGSENFIEEAKVWKTRLGGNLFTSFPFVISDLEGLRHHVPKMEAYYERACEIALALAELPGVVVTPKPPHTNAFEIYLPDDWRPLSMASLKIAETEQIWLFGFLEETAIQGRAMGEITVGEATEQWSTDEIVEAVHDLIILSKDIGNLHS